MWYHLTDMIHGRGQRKRVEYVGETRKKQGIPAVIWCFYSGQSRPDRFMILQTLMQGKVRKNTVKVHKDVQEYSTDETCGARERKNARNSITKVVSLSISKVILLLVLEIQEDMGRSGMVLGNNLGMCKIVSPRWYVSVARYRACRACGQHKGTTRECKKIIRARNL